eukprot:scaffold24244_cov94-Skeletonema_dohrnii-CCMP3373.AAC.1
MQEPIASNDKLRFKTLLLDVVASVTMSSLVSCDEDLSRDRDASAAGEPPAVLDIGTNPKAVQHLAALVGQGMMQTLLSWLKCPFPLHSSLAVDSGEWLPGDAVERWYCSDSIE